MRRGVRTGAGPDPYFVNYAVFESLDNHIQEPAETSVVHVHVVVVM